MSHTGAMPPVQIVSATRTIAAPAHVIFELLAHPAQHHVIDGSGTVRGAQERTPERLSLGAKFGMEMRWGAPYKILNEVVEFEQDRRIAWKHFGGHVWRYVLTPVDDEHTDVTEQFDPTTSKAPLLLKIIGSAKRSQGWIDETLVRLDTWAAERPTE